MKPKSLGIKTRKKYCNFVSILVKENEKEEMFEEKFNRILN